MISIAQYHEEATAMDALHHAKYDESQTLRIEAISAAYKAGLALIAIRDELKSKGASPTNPVETDLGTFTSFENYLLSDKATIKKTAAYSYIKLAENWDVVVKLGMQDTTNPTTRKKCMRLCRTLKVVDWYKEQTTAGRPEEELTLDTYWEEVENHAQVGGLTKRQLQQQLEQTEAELAITRAQLADALRKLTLLEQPQRALTTV
jgi:hypothetical protein